MLKRLKTPIKKIIPPCGFSCCSTNPLPHGKYLIATPGALAHKPYIILQNTIVPLSALLILKNDSFYYSRILPHIKFVFFDLSLKENVCDFYTNHVKKSSFSLIDVPFVFHTFGINFTNLIQINKNNKLPNTMEGEILCDDQIIKSKLVKTVGTFYKKIKDRILLKVIDKRFSFAFLLDDYCIPNTKLEIVLFNNEEEYPCAKLLRVIGKSYLLDTELNSLLIRNNIKVLPYNLNLLIQDFSLEVKNEIIKLIKKKKFQSEIGNINQNNCNNVYEISQELIDLANITTLDSSLLKKESQNFYLVNDVDLNKLISKNYEEIYSKELKNKLRLDLTNKKVFNIDPPGCTDIDDAFHVERMNNFTVIYVHISDVSALIKENSYLDTLCRERGNTYYLDYFRIEMINITSLLSLEQDKLRLTFSVKLTFDGSVLVKKEFFKCVIKNKRSFEYSEADKLLHSKCTTKCVYKTTVSCHTLKNGLPDKRDQSDLYEDINCLNNLAIILRENRMKKGSLNLSVKESLDANHLVEEFMLLANECVAEEISKGISILRRHEGFYFNEPETFVKNESINNEEVQSVITDEELNTEFVTEEIFPATFTQELENKTILEKIYKKIQIRNMKQAEYFCSVDFSSFHFGLAVQKYTHFTSPIRRYADILVHRSLYSLITKDTGYGTLNLNELRNICFNLNISHRNSRNVSREVEILSFYLNLNDSIYTITSLFDNTVIVHENDLELEIDSDVFLKERRVKFVKDDYLFYDCMKFKVILI
ncbi:Exosome complex exonuclease RRP44 [Tubulinosema ratisbonensis]|uniref:DIS3-like exonuclease 1 n=1 Tax=Tubulinosema ratisbonensis TaxID=291195 RepID=A0A437AQ73_9MICR|nr:Exosome complex exonuclease RRP44 [Tubulinosema ratisbonensis]